MVRVHHRHSFYLLFLASVCSIQAQEVVNGQIFSNGLAIINAPAIGSDQHAGSNLVISIDVSGNGRLPESARVPGSNADTRFDTLELYLTSSSSEQNFTVSQGPGLLTQEQGSTVKHLNWPIPRCATPGPYSLSVYEGSHIDGDPYFAITRISFQLLNTSPSSNCDDSVALNPFQASQASSPVSTNPWTGSTTRAETGGSGSNGSGSSPSPSPISLSNAPPSATAEGGQPTPTGPRTTVILMFPQTTVVTEGGTTYTTTMMSTITALRTATSDEPSSFIPINGATVVFIPSIIFSFIATALSMFFAHC